jgi:hypothetical protein
MAEYSVWTVRGAPHTHGKQLYIGTRTSIILREKKPILKKKDYLMDNFDE